MISAFSYPIHPIVIYNARAAGVWDTGVADTSLKLKMIYRRKIMNTSELASGFSEAADFVSTLHVQGKLFLPGEAGYDEARSAWNLAIDQHPALIVMAENAQDVQKAVRYASSHGMSAAVQSTGHGVARKADKALLIRTGLLEKVEIDPPAQTARVGAGAKWGQVLEKAQAYGLAPLLGSSPGVGVTGYTLGGGFGWLGRKYGMAVDSLISVEIVTAGGDLLKASSSENGDLFWAVRGGGGGFGVVTELEIQLYPVTEVYGGNLFYPPELAKEVITRFRDWSANAPDELTSAVTLMNYPPIPVLPEALRGRSFVMVRGCFCGPVEQGEALINEWRNWKAPLMDMFQSMPFSQVAAISADPVDPMPAALTTAWMRELSDEAVDALVKYGLPHSSPLPLTLVEIRQAGGAIGRVDPEANAYGNRSASYCLECVGAAPTPEAEQSFRVHSSQLKQEMQSALTGGVYLNFLDQEEAALRVKDAYLPETYQRLQEIKAKYDPQNVFSHGFYIPPAAK
jgi:hypothetical protein